jgi:hypothetical protein
LARNCRHFIAPLRAWRAALGEQRTWQYCRLRPTSAQVSGRSA